MWWHVGPGVEEIDFVSLKAHRRMCRCLVPTQAAEAFIAHFLISTRLRMLGFIFFFTLPHDFDFSPKSYRKSDPDL